MAKYKVLVIETLSKEVVIEANSAKEAKAIAKDNVYAKNSVQLFPFDDNSHYFVADMNEHKFFIGLNQNKSQAI